MWKGVSALVFGLLLSGCQSLSQSFTRWNSPSSQSLRTITLSGESYTERNPGDFISWVCRDFVNEGRTLVEVGNFAVPELNDAGFVIYDGGNSGESTHYQRKGLNLRWDWGPKGSDFAFILEPDGTGLFYDFSNAEGKTVKANQVFKCRQK